MTWVSTPMSPGPQPTYTSSQGDDPDFPKPPPAGFTTSETLAGIERLSEVLRAAGSTAAQRPEPMVWEGDNA